MTASTALITGASRGIGREVARTLASEGWLVMSAVRDPKSTPPGTQAEVVDMGDSESIEALARRLRARNHRMHALVNNAGVYQGPARQIWDVNVLGPLLLTRGLEPPSRPECTPSDGDERSRAALGPACELGQASVKSKAVTL